MSSSASGLSGADGLGDGDDFLAGEGEEEEEAGEEEAGGGADDFDFAGGDDGGFPPGVGEALCKGFTGPVGFRGADAVGLAVGLGLGEGEGAAVTLESGRQTTSARMKERNLMNDKVDRPLRRAMPTNAAAPPILTEQGLLDPPRPP